MKMLYGITTCALSLMVLAGCQPSTPNNNAAAEAPISTPVMAVKTPPPIYSVDFACANIGGKSTFNVTIGVEGKPTLIELSQSSGTPGLDEAAKKAIEGWEFAAAVRNGQPVPQKIQVPINFTPPKERTNECLLWDEKNSLRKTS